MKIVFFIDHLRHDGSQRVLSQLVAGLSARGHALAVVCLNASWDDEIVAALRGAGAELRAVGAGRLVLGYGLLGLWLWMRQRRFDVAATLLFVSDVLGRPLARLAGVPRLLSSIRARNIHYAPWQLALVRATMPLADAVIVNSTATLPWAVDGEGARAERTRCIPNGVDIGAYARPYRRDKLRALFGVAPGHTLVGCVGRLTAQKGQDLLIQAVAQLGRTDVTLLLIGAGKDEQKLRALAAELGLSGRVCFAGYRDDTAYILGALDLYAHPARFEGMANALLEAMAAGCPIVASAVDGNRDLLDEASGWLVPVGDVTALTAAIGAALDDPGAARRRGDAARSRAQASFSVAAMVEAWEIALSTRP